TAPIDKVDIGIITVREDECAAVLQRFPDAICTASGRRRYRIRRLQLSPTEAYTVAVLRCAEQGNGEAQAAARDLLEDLAPAWILVVGIAGGVPAHEFSLGDVIVSNRITDFSVEAVLEDHSRAYALAGGPLHPDAATVAADICGMVNDGELEGWNDETAIGRPLPPVEIADDKFYGDDAWKQDVRGKIERRFRTGPARPSLVTTGAIGSSDRLIKDDEILKVWLKIARQVQAVEMESAGVYRATHGKQVPFLAIRGISDVVGFQRHPDWTEYACHSAAGFTLAFLSARPFEPRKGVAEDKETDNAPDHRTEPRDPSASLPEPGIVVGRESLTARLVEELLREPPRSVLVLGPAGIGKSTLTLAAAHRPEVAERYGVRRWFVRLDAAATAPAAVALIAEAVGVKAPTDLFTHLCSALGRERSLLILDNLETPWEGAPSETEAVLAKLAKVPRLRLVASVRGAQSPAVVHWSDRIKMTRLEPDEAAELFCELAPEHRDRRDALASLLAPLDGVPLAITLLAHAAEGNDLANLMNEWQRLRTAALARPSAQQDRLSSWAVSVELSIVSKRMTPEAKRLGAVLASLPNGIAVADLDVLFADGSTAARVLSQVGLAFFEARRLQMLAPIREHFTREHRPDDADLDWATEHYGELACALGPKAGKEGGAAAAARLAPEVANLDAMIRRGLEGPNALRWVDTALALAGFSYLSGRSTPSPLEAARRAAARAGAVAKEARCIVRLGDLLVRRAEHPQALESFEHALRIYREERDTLGEAGCVRRLGDLAQQREDLDEAVARYEEALALSRRAGDVRGQAHCIKGLGRIALQRGDHEQAQARYEEARTLFRQVKDLLGEHGSIRRLGDVALDRGDHERARANYEAARTLCREVADVLGEAKSVLGLGHVARRRSQVEEARARYEEAIPLFRQAGDLSGEDECERCLGSIGSRTAPP
ncbi:MAG TPA: tetratricopeptide repeat protein, partial [Candidatus Nanopelagicales bacterium]|nr:tetratricopeptide repeat protein [Candidatus Nanopelagicales bacterium]